MASHIPFAIQTHKQKVLSLYKKSLRCIESWCPNRIKMRYNVVLMRAEFDQNKNIKDDKVAVDLLAKGEQRLWEFQHYQPKRFANSIGGNAYGREHVTPDYVLDFWHPLEKAQYPEYFARREKRKEEYIKMWDKEFGGSK